MNPKLLDCKGEFNKCKIDIVGNRRNEILKELLKRIGRMERKMANKKY